MANDDLSTPPPDWIAWVAIVLWALVVASIWIVSIIAGE